MAGSGCPVSEVGLVHGKLKPDEKEAVMRRFRDGEIAALVATTVIEVGVDVPNATVMIMHHAERFGLAQLHQLRGRIGRGGHKGYCILLADGKNPEAIEKLRVLEQSADGFEIAEADLRLRGPGDVLGTMQSGLSDLSSSISSRTPPCCVKRGGCGPDYRGGSGSRGIFARICARSFMRSTPACPRCTA